MHIERHIFGSYKGYTTLARSPGVSTDDSRILERSAYSFGQTYDARFNKTLARTPAFFTRTLRGGRRALARVLAGAPDDNNRPTLRVVTVIVSQQDWDSQLFGDVQLLLEEERLWQWDGSSQPDAMEITFRPPSHSVPRKSVSRVLALLSEIERGHAAHRGVVVSANEFSQQEIACLEILVPPSARAEFTSAYRTLSPQLQATVNCLAAEAGSQDRVTFRFQPEHTPLSPYAEYLHDSGFASGSIPLETIMAYNRFGMPPVQPPSEVQDTPVSLAPITVVQRAQTWPLFAVALMAVVLSVGAFVGAQLLSGNQAKDLQSQVDDMRGVNSTLGNDLVFVKSSFRELREEPDELRKKVTEISGNVIKLKRMLGEQQLVRFNHFKKEIDRLKKKVKKEGILHQNSQEFRLLYNEAIYLEKGLLDSGSKESLSRKKAEIDNLCQIFEAAEGIAEWENKMNAAKTEDEKKHVANEIREKVYEAFFFLEEFNPRNVKEIDLNNDYVNLKKKVTTVRKWVDKNASGKTTTAPAPGK